MRLIPIYTHVEYQAIALSDGGVDDFPSLRIGQIIFPIYYDLPAGE